MRRVQLVQQYMQYPPAMDNGAECVGLAFELSLERRELLADSTVLPTILQQTRWLEFVRLHCHKAIQSKGVVVGNSVAGIGVSDGFLLLSRFQRLRYFYLFSPFLLFFFFLKTASTIFFNYHKHSNCDFFGNPSKLFIKLNY